MADHYFTDMKRRCVGEYDEWKRQKDDKTKSQRSKQSKELQKLKSTLILFIKLTPRKHCRTNEGKACRRVAIMNLTAEGRAKLKKSEKLLQKYKHDPEKLSELSKDRHFNSFYSYHQIQSESSRSREKQYQSINKKRKEKELMKVKEEIMSISDDDDNKIVLNFFNNAIFSLLYSDLQRNYKQISR